MLAKDIMAVLLIDTVLIGGRFINVFNSDIFLALKIAASVLLIILTVTGVFNHDR